MVINEEVDSNNGGSNEEGENHAESSNKEQPSEGYLFLHEQPAAARRREAPASSWDVEEVVALQVEDGGYTVIGPMCYWNGGDDDDRDSDQGGEYFTPLAGSEP